MLVLLITTKEMTKESNPHMQTGPLVTIDEEVDDVEEVQGRPGEEEQHAHTHQNPDFFYEFLNFEHTSNLFHFCLLINLIQHTHTHQNPDFFYEFLNFEHTSKLFHFVYCVQNCFCSQMLCWTMERG